MDHEPRNSDALRSEADIFPTFQSAFDRYAPDVCRKNKCRVAVERDSSGQARFRHGKDGYSLPEVWMRNPEKDIWAEIKSWLEELHARQ